MKILKIVKKDSKNALVHFDNDESLFLAYEVLLKNGLKKNDEISESRFSFLIEENQKFFIKQAAFRYLGRRLHSVKELRMKLLQKKYRKELIDGVLNDLIEKNYLNDYKFASEYVDEKGKNKLWGRNKLKSELFNKGIESKIINQVLNEKFSDGNNLDSALLLGKKKLSILLHRKTPDNKIESKIISYLLSKGYDYETAKRTISLLIK